MALPGRCSARGRFAGRSIRHQFWCSDASRPTGRWMSNTEEEWPRSLYTLVASVSNAKVVGRYFHEFDRVDRRLGGLGLQTTARPSISSRFVQTHSFQEQLTFALVVCRAGTSGTAAFQWHCSVACGVRKALA